MNHDETTAITGMGVMSAHGRGVPALANALLTARNPFHHSSHYAILNFPVINAELPPFDFTQAVQQSRDLPESILTHAIQAGRRAPLTIQVALLSALEAWVNADLHQRRIAPERISLIVAGQNTTQAYQYQMQQSFHKDPSYLTPKYALHFMDTDHVGTLSEVLQIQGEGFTVGGASASSHLALQQAHRLLQTNAADVCLVIGALADLSPLEIQAFANAGALGGKHFAATPQLACRPFDKQHEGFIWGQAGACLVLEKTAHANKHQQPILAKMPSFTMRLSANRSADPDLATEIAVMRSAITNAGLSLNDIQYINAHGTSSTLGDCIEAEAIATLFADATTQPWINSTKSLTGHCLWSAGLVETIATVIQMQTDFLHANLNLEDPIRSDCRFVGRQPENTKTKIALNNAFGFGGIHASFILLNEDLS